ncbi:MAG: DUF362 domain-containing protein [Dysgonamonadaceae bacterium]|jgi:hypothetical protein|nr:DUF362 domain-containing protein [Dysgonamonadaceae bacterium]
MKKLITRRDLLKKAAFMAVGGTVLLNRPVSAWAWAKGKDAKSKVILIRNRQLFAGEEQPDATIAAQMLDEAVCALTGKNTVKEAWASIIKPADIVGIKTNVWNKFPTPEIMNDILKERVLQTGVSEDNVNVNDRGVLKDPVFQKATALINVRPMRTHAWSGVGSCIKNYIMFSPQPSSYHDDSCASLATLYELPIVKNKTRLHVLVMFKPLFHHRTAQDASEEYMWKYSGLIVGFDPVAVDSVGLRIIQGKRNAFFQEDRPLNPPAKHIELADTRYHLGTADPAKIELVKLGWEEESFV